MGGVVLLSLSLVAARFDDNGHTAAVVLTLVCWVSKLFKIVLEAAVPAILATGRTKRGQGYA